MVDTSSPGLISHSCRQKPSLRPRALSVDKQALVSLDGKQSLLSSCGRHPERGSGVGRETRRTSKEGKGQRSKCSSEAEKAFSVFPSQGSDVLVQDLKSYIWKWRRVYSPELQIKIACVFT